MKPMLSATVEDVESLQYPLLASPKLDGIRCVIVDGVPHSRNLKLIPNAFIQDALRRLELPALDGELIVGDAKAADCFNKSTSGVMSREGAPKFTFWVFDQWDHPDAFAARLITAEKVAQRKMSKLVKAVPHKLVRDAAGLLAYEAQMLLAGFEGVMVRDPLGPYKHGRATLREGSLAKLKRFADGEAEIIGFVEREHNANEQTKDELGRAKRSSHKAGKVKTGTLGALQVRDVKSGVEFEIGTGFDDAQRAAIWARRPHFLWKLAKYKSQPVGVKDKPRFPVFLGLRDAIDL